MARILLEPRSILVIPATNGTATLATKHATVVVFFASPSAALRKVVAVFALLTFLFSLPEGLVQWLII
jgi:hypothetical protein